MKPARTLERLERLTSRLFRSRFRAATLNAKQFRLVDGSEESTASNDPSLQWPGGGGDPVVHCDCAIQLVLVGPASPTLAPSQPLPVIRVHAPMPVMSHGSAVDSFICSWIRGFARSHCHPRYGALICGTTNSVTRGSGLDHGSVDQWLCSPAVGLTSHETGSQDRIVRSESARSRAARDVRGAV